MNDINDIDGSKTQDLSGGEEKENVTTPDGELNRVSDRENPMKDEPVKVKMIEIQSLLARMDNLEKTVGELTVEIKQLGQRLEFIPPQVRQLSVKVDDMTESISHPRTRDLLGRFLQLNDLVEQMGLTAPDTVSAANYQVLRDQILQTLKLNGIYVISDSKRFDPNIHKVVEIVNCQNPVEDGEIVRIYRPGFRTDRTVLRYMEVVVKRASGPKSTT